MYTRSQRGSGDTRPTPAANSNNASGDTVKRAEIQVRAIPSDYGGTVMRFDDRMFSDTGEEPFVPDVEEETEVAEVDFDFGDGTAEVFAANTDRAEPQRTDISKPQHLDIGESQYMDRAESQRTDRAEPQRTDRAESQRTDRAEPQRTDIGESQHIAEPPYMGSDGDWQSRENDREAAFDAIYAPFLNGGADNGCNIAKSKPLSSDFGEPVITRRGDYDPPSNPNRANESIPRGEENHSGGIESDGERSGEAMPNLLRMLPMIKGSVEDDELLLAAMIILLLLSGADDDVIILLAFLLMTG